jgi:glycosyltransferase involved in cell wall biosynthesis
MLQDKYELPEEFLLFVGAVEPRKNLPGLLDALKILEQRYGRIPLLIIGRKGSDYHNLQACIKRNGLDSSVRVLDYLPDEDVQGIYGLSTLFVFPSLCEGFGFPLLEAMASGVPIAASQAAALPEIAGDAALYFDPASPESIAEALRTGLEDGDVRRRLVERGRVRIQEFDWERSAHETLGFYRELTGGS